MDTNRWVTRGHGEGGGGRKRSGREAGEIREVKREGGRDKEE